VTEFQEGPRRRWAAGVSKPPRFPPLFSVFPWLLIDLGPACCLPATKLTPTRSPGEDGADLGVGGCVWWGHGVRLPRRIGESEENKTSIPAPTQAQGVCLPGSETLYSGGGSCTSTRWRASRPDVSSLRLSDPPWLIFLRRQVGPPSGLRVAYVGGRPTRISTTEPQSHRDLEGMADRNSGIARHDESRRAASGTARRQ
jgi:hypothetical protein